MTRFSIINRWCWKILAGFLVLFALLVSLIRGLLPQFDNVRHDLVSFISNEYQIEVFIGKISAEWQAYGPSITVDNLILPPQEKLPATVILQQVQFKVDFWQSLLTLSPKIENVLVDGVHLGIDIDKLQSARQPSKKQQEKNKSTEAVKAITNHNLDWLYSLMLEQFSQFTMFNVNLQMLSAEQSYRPIRINNFHWSNDGNKHLGQGEVLLDLSQEKPENLSLRFDFTGDGFKPETVTGLAYLDATSLDIGEWTGKQPSVTKSGVVDSLPAKIEGVVNLQAWADFSKRNWNSIFVKFEPSWLKWNAADIQKFEINSAELLWQSTEHGWQLNSNQLDFVSNDKAWPELSVQANYRNGVATANINQLNLEYFQPLLPLLPMLGTDKLPQWQALAPKGQIGPIQFSYNPADGSTLHTNIEQLTWASVDNNIGIQPIALNLLVTDNKVQLHLPAQEYELDFGEGFIAPIHLEGKEAVAQFDLNSKTLLLPQLAMKNNDIELDAALWLDFEGSAEMALSANMKINNVSHAFLYFPHSVMDTSLIDYLTGALQAGKIPDAKIVWQGEFANYPFSEHEGIFQAGFSLTDSNFRFQPDWPSITELDLDALFENKRMDIWVNRGQLQNVAVDGAHAFILNLGNNAELGVQAEVTPTGEDATELLLSSPLSDSVGEVLNVVQVQGQVVGVLDMNFPLYEGGVENVRGQIELNDNSVFIEQPGIDLGKVKGKVRFHNDVVEGDELTAVLFEQPFNFSFDTGPKDFGLKGEGSALHANFGGEWDLSKLPSSLDNPLSEYYSGNFDWKGQLKILFTEQNFTLQANASSDLVGTTLLLPAQFAKQSADKEQLQVELMGDNAKTTLGIKLGKKMEFWGELGTYHAEKLKSFDVILGRQFKAGDQLSESGGQLNVELSQSTLNDWLPIINRFTQVNEENGQHPDTPESSTAQSVGFFPPLQYINAKIDELNVFGQALRQLNLQGKDNNGVWTMDADSDNFTGQLKFYPDWERQGLQITAEKLYLFSELENDEATPELDKTSESEVKLAKIDVQNNQAILNSLPALKIDAKDFTFFGKPFGQLSLTGMKSEQGYRLDNVELSTEQTSIKGTGLWRFAQQNGTDATELDFTLTASKFDYLAEQFDSDPGMKDAPVNLQAQINWIGAPYDFALQRLNGDLHFELGKGHLSEVSDKGARIFSLFSLDSLLRKLSFDFSDVFGKGLYFDTFEGDLRVDDGVVKTTNTIMDAVAGTIKVRGYTDLSQESLNYDIRFSPKLASSVPAVVLLSTSAWTLGVGAFALTKVLEPVIEIISEIRFRLTGTLSDPKIEELERKSKEIEIPEAVLREVNPDAVIPAKEANAETKQPEEQEPTKQDSTQPTEEDNKQKIIKRKKNHSVQPSKVIPLTFNGASHADKFIAMSKQSRCSAKFAVYPRAA
ncbi:TIGR02099 family protein [Parashewanella spongiae]|uniref:TIGR02099 family protein n=1 Tax=Parashewanella spongiae TaxID=342950 RepID=A0A3A6TTA0_9GAMM|nr:YhdP family protein [Parashewanella spongiae]MCL1078257.1 TIGR02099 family protein [Parashewanella spongiae]RJY15095.1 TIGR02099 family protein [Parashewanella spongiae]